MNDIFLSASIPVAGRGNFYTNASPYLIQMAVKQLLFTVLGRKRIIFGGHPAITPMVIGACHLLDIDIDKSIVLYQSKYFEGKYPDENKYFHEIVYTDNVSNDLELSLYEMRTRMLSRNSLSAAVFIGGMDGVIKEFDILKEHYPTVKIIALGKPGGAASDIARRIYADKKMNNTVDFIYLFHSELGIDADDIRN